MARLDADRTEWRMVEGEVVGLDRDQREYFVLNPSGSLLWRMLAEGATEDQLVEEMATQFSLPEEQARADTRTFLDLLQQRGLIATSTD